LTISSVTPIRVMLVKDHPMVRRGLATMLMVFDDMRLVGEAESGQAAIQLCARQRQLERFSGLGIICNANRRSPMCAWPKCANFASWMKPATAWYGRRHRAVHEPDELNSSRLSPHPETGANHRRLSGQRRHPNAARSRLFRSAHSRRSAPVSAKGNDRVMNKLRGARLICRVL